MAFGKEALPKDATVRLLSSPVSMKGRENVVSCSIWSSITPLRIYITAEAGSWCIAVSTFPESAEINGFDVDQMGDVDLDV